MSSARALVLGAGVSGLALARHLTSAGAPVRLADRRPAAELADALGRIPAGVDLVLGGYTQEVLDGCAEVYASPGVAWDDPLLVAARVRGLHVSSEIDLFFGLCPAPIVAITGTNGKTTTTALTADILSLGDRPVLVGGNIGDTVLDRLAEITPRHWVVLELSSFQLESVERPRVRIGAVLNITPDHLDRHHTFEAYLEAKARIVTFMEPGDTAVLNGEDTRCVALATRTRGSVVWFDRHRPDPPMSVPGRHNLMNARAAAAIARAAGIDDATIARGVAGFRGVEHRLELVGEWGGVRWYNDSKATNPDAGLVALDAFPGVPLVLIAGGYGSGFELGAWVAAVRRTCRVVILVGASADLLERELAGHPIRRASSLDEAVLLAAHAAGPGDAVLLSPAYKSFDMFSNYGERGRAFKAAARRLHGEVSE